MTLKEARDDMLRKVWIELSDQAPSYLYDDMAVAFNQAMQVIWQSPSDYFRRKHYSLATVIGTDSYTLDSGIQEVLGPVRLNGSHPHLRPVADRGNFDHYHTRYKGGTNDTPANAKPEAYYIERLNVAGDDSVQISMLLAPTPDAVYFIDYEASTEAPRYTANDLATGSAVNVPMPHAYAESIFLPVARYYAMRSHYFSHEEHRSAFNGDYLNSMMLLGVSDPQLPEVKGVPQPSAPEKQ